MDVRDKLLFEPEYAGNVREKIPPKCSQKIPWVWLPGALCLLQEVHLCTAYDLVLFPTFFWLRKMLYVLFAELCIFFPFF